MKKSPMTAALCALLASCAHGRLPWFDATEQPALSAELSQLLDEGELEAARDQLLAATEAEPQDPQAWLALGDVALALKDQDQSRSAYLQGMALQEPGQCAWTGVHLALAGIYEDEKASARQDLHCELARLATAEPDEARRGACRAHGSAPALQPEQAALDALGSLLDELAPSQLGSFARNGGTGSWSGPGLGQGRDWVPRLLDQGELRLPPAEERERLLAAQLRRAMLERAAIEPEPSEDLLRLLAQPSLTLDATIEERTVRLTAALSAEAEPFHEKRLHSALGGRLQAAEQLLEARVSDPVPEEASSLVLGHALVRSALESGDQLVFVGLGRKYKAEKEPWDEARWREQVAELDQQMRQTDAPVVLAMRPTDPRCAMGGAVLPASEEEGTELEQALASCRAAAAATPGFWYYPYAIAGLQAQMGRHEEALLSLQSALGATSDPAARLRLRAGAAQVHSALGDGERLLSYAKVSSLEPAEVVPWLSQLMSIGETVLSKDQSARLMRWAAEQDPEHAPAYLLLAGRLGNEVHQPEAEADLLAVLAEDCPLQEDEKPRGYTGFAYAKGGKALTKALDLSCEERHAEAQPLLLTLLARLERPQEALDLARSLAAAEPAQATKHLPDLISAFRRAEDRQNAAQACLILLACQQGDAPSDYNLSQCGDHLNAAQLAEQALPLVRQHLAEDAPWGKQRGTGLLRLLAQLLVAQDEPAAAEQAWREIGASLTWKDPSTPQRELALLLRERGEHARALTEARAALARKDNKENRVVLADTLLAADEPLGAYRALLDIVIFLQDDKYADYTRGKKAAEAAALCAEPAVAPQCDKAVRRLRGAPSAMDCLLGGKIFESVSERGDHPQAMKIRAAMQRACPDAELDLEQELKSLRAVGQLGQAYDLAMAAERPPAVKALAYAHLAAGEAQRGEDLLRRRTELDRVPYRARVDLADYLLETGDRPRARQVLQAALQAEPTDSAAFSLLTRLMIEDGEIEQALAQAPALMEAAGEEACKLAVEQQGLLSRLGRQEEAKDVVRAILGGAIPCKWRFVYRSTLQAMPALGMSEEALAAMEECPARFAEEDQAPGQRAMVCTDLHADLLTRDGQHEAGLALLEQTLQTQPASLRLTSKAARLASALGRTDRQEELLRQILAAKPEDKSARSSLFYLLRRQGREEEATALVDEGCRIDPEFILHLNMKGWLLKQERHAELQAYLDAITTPSSDYYASTVLRLRADLNHALDQDGQGIALLRQDHREHQESGTARALASFLVEAEDESGAERVLREQLAREPQSRGLRGQLVRLLLKRGELQRALAVAQQAPLSKTADKVNFWRDLGDALGDFGHLEQGLDWCQRALELAPHERSPRGCVVTNLERLGRWAEAEQVLRDAIGRTSYRELDLFSLAEHFADTDRPHKALQVADQLLAGQPTHSKATKLRARALLSLGRSQESDAAMARYAYLSPSSNARGIQALHLIRLGELERAQALAEATLAEDPTEEMSVAALAGIAERRGQWQQAVAHYQKAVEILPGYRWAHLRLAHLLQRHGSAEEAAEAARELDRVYQEERDESPGRMGMTRWHAEALARHGPQPERALALAQAVHERAPSPATSWTMARVLALLDRHEEALPHLEQALEQRPPLASDLLLRAEILAGLGRKDQAQQALEQAIVLEPAHYRRQEVEEALR